MAEAMIVADYIIYRASELHKPVNNLKLQKIMFFLNVQYLLEKKKSLVLTSQFEKLSYGPMIRQVYREYGNKFGKEKIIKPTTFKYIIRENNKFKLITYHFNKTDLAKNIRDFIDLHLNYFLSQPVFNLVTASQRDPQWQNKAIKNYNEKELIDYYTTHQFWQQDKWTRKANRSS